MGVPNEQYHFPECLILDFEDIFWRMRRDVSMIYPYEVDWDLLFSRMFSGLGQLEQRRLYYGSWLENQDLIEQVLDIANGDEIFPDLFDVNKMDNLYRVLKRGGLEIKERLLTLMAYHHGVFPYTYRTMISDGCLFFSKNESIYDTRVPDPEF